MEVPETGVEPAKNRVTVEELNIEILPVIYDIIRRLESILTYDLVKIR